MEALRGDPLSARKQMMSRITQASLVSAIKQIADTNPGVRESICDEIFVEQPNLLASVLVLTKMDIPPRHVEMALEALMVMHLALKASGKRIETITEAEQERELRRLLASVRFSEGLELPQVNESVRQYVGFKKEPWLLSYVLELLRESRAFFMPNEAAKYLVLSVFNMVACVANAQSAVNKPE